MFIHFLFLLRDRYGLEISTQEWMLLLEALEKGLHESTLTGFYQLCRLILIKSEAELDQFDLAFLEFFQDLQSGGGLPEEFLEWLDKPEMLNPGFYNQLLAQANLAYSNAEIAGMFQERLQEQKEEHNLGSYYVGTGGVSHFGHSGYSPNGIRTGGESRFRNAFAVAGERMFRDFREDRVPDTRQMQIAFRRLRQYSANAGAAKEAFSLSGTVDATCQNAGRLKIVYERPRGNSIKLLLLIDSGGSMYHYGKLSSALFHAVNQANHFKDLKIYYFHNCVYDRLYEDPLIQEERSVSTQRLLDQLSEDYRVVFAGDAQMNPDELMKTSYFSFNRYGYHDVPGIVWLQRFHDRFRHTVWLNPEPRPRGGAYWNSTYDAISELFGGMYLLTPEGLNDAMKRLLVSR